MQAVGQEVDAQRGEVQHFGRRLRLVRGGRFPRRRAQPLTEDLYGRGNLSPGLVADAPQPQQPTHRGGEQVLDGEDVGPIEGVGGPRAQPQLGNRRIVGRAGQQLAELEPRRPGRKSAPARRCP